MLQEYCPSPPFARSSARCNGRAVLPACRSARKTPPSFARSRASLEGARYRESRWLEIPWRDERQNEQVLLPALRFRLLLFDEASIVKAGAPPERTRIRNHDRTALLLQKNLFASHWSPLFEHSSFRFCGHAAK